MKKTEQGQDEQALAIIPARGEPPFAQMMAARMMDYQPIPWALLPDLGLYMDQVITFLERQLAPLYAARTAGARQGRGGEGERVLTPSMINNYVKQGVIPRPNGKKYEREHLAALLMVCALKQVLPMDAIVGLIGREPKDLCARYEAFCAQQQQVLRRTGELLAAGQATAMLCAVEAGAQCLAAEALLAPAPDGA